jgi:hypothetical protein
MEIAFKILASLLGALSVFAAAAGIELIKKLLFLQRRRSRAIREHVMKEDDETTSSETLPEDPEQLLAPELITPQNSPATTESFPWGPHGPKLERVPSQVLAPPFQSKSNFGPFIALSLVICVFATSIGVIWALTHIGGPIEAGVKTTIEKAGGSILIVGTGLFGAFFVVALMAFAAIHVFSGSFDR